MNRFLTLFVLSIFCINQVFSQCNVGVRQIHGAAQLAAFEQEITGCTKLTGKINIEGTIGDIDLFQNIDTVKDHCPFIILTSSM